MNNKSSTLLACLDSIKDDRHITLVEWVETNFELIESVIGKFHKQMLSPIVFNNKPYTKAYDLLVDLAESDGVITSAGNAPSSQSIKDSVSRYRRKIGSSLPKKISAHTLRVENKESSTPQGSAKSPMVQEERSTPPVEEVKKTVFTPISKKLPTLKNEEMSASFPPADSENFNIYDYLKQLSNEKSNGFKNGLTGKDTFFAESKIKTLYEKNRVKLNVSITRALEQNLVQSVDTNVNEGIKLLTEKLSALNLMNLLNN